MPEGKKCPLVLAPPFAYGLFGQSFGGSGWCSSLLMGIGHAAQKGFRTLTRPGDSSRCCLYCFCLAANTHTPAPTPAGFLLSSSLSIQNTYGSRYTSGRWNWTKSILPTSRLLVAQVLPLELHCAVPVDVRMLTPNLLHTLFIIFELI